MQISFNKKFKFTLVLLSCLSLTTIACKKESVSYEKDKLECDEINKCQNVIYTLHLDKTISVFNYISLGSKNLVTSEDHWDFSMSGQYASELNANTSFNGRLNFIDIEFDNVTAEKILEKFGPTQDFNSKFKNLENFSMHKLLGDEEGWADYDMDSHIMMPLKNRTLLLITADTTDNTKHKLFKIKMISMYEGCLLRPTREDKLKVPYLTCRFEEINIDIDNLLGL